ncbi:MAG: hypothetical protein ACJ0GE_01165 [Candidatus Actinomarina sp.]|tara:strand:+ start:509 stop:1147 length:639 start_codon:yes stop_codon:yes gene_type:complete
METFKDEIKNLKAITRVIAVGVLVNFVILALVLGPDSVGYDPTYGPITAILNFVIAFLTTGVLLGIYVVFDVKQTFDLSHMHNILFVSVTVQMLFSLGAVFNYYSVFDTVLDTDTVGAISGSFTNTVFFLYGMYAYLLVRTDKRRGNQLSSRTQTVGTVFAAIIIPVQALTLFGLVPAAVFAPLFVLGGVILYPLFIIGVGDAIGNHTVQEA